MTLAEALSRRVGVELLPVRPGEFTRWVRLCAAAGRFGWGEVGALSPYREHA